MTLSQNFEAMGDSPLTLRESLLITLSLSASVGHSESGFLFEPEIICRRADAGAKTLCPKLTHLRLGVRSDTQSDFDLRLLYDPFHTRKATWFDLKGLGLQDLPDQQSWLNDYALRMRLGSASELSLENWSGTTLLPDASGMAFSRALQDTSWDQTALRYTWINPDLSILAASLVAGLGEGETFQENDSEPYLGFLGRFELGTSLSTQIGWSLDRNFLNRSALPWIDQSLREEARQSFSAERYAVSFFIDGSHPKARGLRLGLGWQRSHIKGPSEVKAQTTLLENLTLDPNEALAESLGARSNLLRDSFSISASYLILGTYLISYHQEELKVDLRNSGSFLSCDALTATGICRGEVRPASSFRVKGLGYAIGKRVEDSWSLLLESYQQKYDQLYQIYHFASGRDQRSADFRLLQLRLDYRM